MAAQRVMGARPGSWLEKCILTFQAELGRELNLDESVAIAANTKAAVRKHFRVEFEREAPF